MTVKKTDQALVGRIVYATNVTSWPRALSKHLATVAKIVAVRGTGTGWVLTVETGTGRVGTLLETMLTDGGTAFAPADASLYPNREDAFLVGNLRQVLVTGEDGATTVSKEVPPQKQSPPERLAAWLGL